MRPAARIAWLVLLALALLAGAARGDEPADPQGMSRSALLAEARTLERRSIDDARESEARWDRVHALAEAYGRRFPGDADAAEMAFLRAVAAFNLARWEDASRALEAFLAGHPEDPRALTARYLRALVHAERFEDEAAVRALEALETDEQSPEVLRGRARYARAQVAIRRGERDAAMDILRALVESAPPEHPMARRAHADLKDLARVGGQPPPLPADAPEARVLVVVARREGEREGEALLAEARGEAQGLAGCAVYDLRASGFDDARLEGLRPPALPRVYVIGPRGALRVILGAGLRKAAIRAAIHEGLAP